MKNLQKHFLLFITSLIVLSCSKDSDNTVSNSITLHFNNTFKDESIILGDANSTTATVNTSVAGQLHHFSELKYVISNIRLVLADGREFPYHINDLDQGAFVVDQAKPESLDFELKSLPAGTYKEIRFGLGVKPDLNILDEVRFPQFYAATGANDTKMMWEWGTGYRFTKIEGFYDNDNRQMSIHTGSTVQGNEADPDTYVQGVDAYRDIVLPLPSNQVVGRNALNITIKADFDKLLSGTAHTISLRSGGGNNNHNNGDTEFTDATPNVHSAVQMKKFVDNLGGSETNGSTGMFSISQVAN